MNPCRYLLLTLICFSPYAFAGDDNTPVTATSIWENTLKLGGAANSGNSDSTNLNGGLTSKLIRKDWSYSLAVGGELNTGNGVKTAENVKGDASARYFIQPKFYGFFKGNITYDAFATYDFVIKESLGLGRVLLHTEKHDLLAEAGPGGTHQRISGTRDFQDEFILNISAAYTYHISDTANFSQSASYDWGQLNNHTEAVTAVTTKVTDGLALEISFTAKHDSKIPANSTNRKKTDTVTKVNIVYDF